MMTPERLRQRRRERSTQYQALKKAREEHMAAMERIRQSGQAFLMAELKPQKPRAENICWILWCIATTMIVLIVSFT